MRNIQISLFLSLLLIVLFPSPVWATEASLKCLPTTGTYNVGDTFTVEYTLDTRTFPVYGADVEATYDRGVIEPVGSASTSISTVTNWTAPATNTINTQAGTTGKIPMDYGNGQPAFTGTTSIGNVTFQAKAAGQAQFNYVFFQQYDNTTPGVAKVWGKRDASGALSNILTDVNNCIYVVVDTSPTPIPTTPPIPTSPPPPVVTSLPRSGAIENTVSLIGLGMLFIILGGVFMPVFLKGKN